jgi:excinuclease UvrABC nuclease subunit
MLRRIRHVSLITFHKPPFTHTIGPVKGFRDILTNRADFDPAGDFDAFTKNVPARWAVYLLADAEDRPVQLLCVKNLRYSLRRRLGPEDVDAGPSRRVDYREIVRRICWRRVDSAFEADWAYYEAARLVFPQTYQGMVGFRPAWFVHVNPEANFPRYQKTTDLTRQAGLYLGPLEDKHAAARLIELAESAFDLCRYYPVLVEAPNARACAYKEMGKCPAPCDGSISMGQYRDMIERSARTLVDPADVIRDQADRMRQAAADLKFEAAGRIKQFLAQLEQLGKGPFRHVSLLSNFAYLALQHGPRPGRVKVFLITPGRVEEIAGLIGDPRPAELIHLALTVANERGRPEIDEAGAERVGVVTHHLFAPTRRGVFLRLDGIDEKSVARGLKDLQKQGAPEETEGEGVMKELQAL